MKLHYQQQGSGKTIFFLHGMLGSLSNLNSLANAFAMQYKTVQVDLRNHGCSPWAKEMGFDVMAQDIIELCKTQQLTNVTFIGHSMGGKLAMLLTQLAPQLIDQIIVLDIAPVRYQSDANLTVLTLLLRCIAKNLSDRKQITAFLKQEGLAESTIQFLLKSYRENRWRFNVEAIYANYEKICDWQPITPWQHPILFIRGAQSNYVTKEYYAKMLQQFPYMQIETVTDAGHNVHADNPESVLTILRRWITV